MDLLFACEIGFLNNYVDDVINMIPKDGQPESFIFFLDGDEEESTPDIYTIDGTEARIDIQGPLSKTEPSAFMKRRYGGTSYPSIMRAIEAIKDNPEVEIVRLIMDTPGGVVTGLDEVWIGLRELAQSKRVIAENHGMIASAGYWIASAASQIVALSPGAETGSIGVQMVQTDWTKFDEMKGIKEVKILSKNAPKKNPDVSDKDGISLIQDRLDALERVFISRIAEGRGVSEEKIKTDFGQGALLIAEDPDAKRADALSVGMIDKVLNANTTPATGPGSEDDDEGDMIAGATPFKNLPIVDKTWDSTAAIKRVRTKTGSTDKPSASYKNAFFWYDEADKENFGAYKLPFVDVVDGSLKAVRRGVFAANAAMQGARGGVKIPAADKPAVQKHIDKYRDKIAKEDEKKEEGSTRQQSAETRNMEVLEMNELERLCQDNPALVGEVETIRREAFEAGAASIAARIKAAVPFLTSEAYTKQIKELAVKVLNGESNKDALEGAVAVFDSFREDQASAAAATESEASGEVESAAGDELSSDGIIRSEADYQKAIVEHRAAQGR